MYRVSKLVASSDINFFLTNDSRTISVVFNDNCDIEALLMDLTTSDSFSARNLFLHFEKLRGNDMLPVIDIYLNLEQENMPEDNNYVGSMALYGLGESSTQSFKHDGDGQERIFNVVEVFGRVRKQPNWSKQQFNITLIPYQSLPVDAVLTIGLVSLYFNET